MNAERQIIPNRAADGVLRKVGDIYYVHRDGSDDVLVAAHFPGKGGGKTQGPIKLVEGHANESVHVEFCGTTVTRLTSPGRDVLISLPTQSALDEIYAKEKRVDWVILVIAAFAIAGSIAGFRATTRKH